MPEQSVNDRSFLRLIRKRLKAGILEDDGRVLHPARGHRRAGWYRRSWRPARRADRWTERTVRRECRGQVNYMRYADDFVCGLEAETEAHRYVDELRERLA